MYLGKHKWKFMARMTRRGRAHAAVLTGVLLLMLSLTGSATSAAEADSAVCDHLWQTQAQHRIPSRYLVHADLGHKVQQGLGTIFAGDPEYQTLLGRGDESQRSSLDDDRIGPVTRSWLRRLCVDYPAYGSAAKLPEAIMQSALHYAEIAERHTDWRATITGPAFSAWVEATAASDLRQLRRSGAAPVVSGLLDEFTGAKHTTVDERCERLLDPGIQTKDPLLSPNSTIIGRKIQQGLEAVFAGNPEYDGVRSGTDLLFDGIVGQRTRQWMARFCREFPAAGAPDDLPDNLVRSLLHYAEIAEVHPDWREIITNPDFKQWIGQPLPQGERGDRQLRLSGSAPVVNQLIAQFLDRGRAADDEDAPLDECSEAAPSGASVYYLLSQQDLQRLQEREAFIAQVEKLVGKKFATEEELSDAIGPTAERLQDRCMRQQFLKALQHGNPASDYRLTGESLDRIINQLTLPERTGQAGDVHFTAKLIAALEQLQDKGFTSKRSLAQFIRFQAQLALAGDAASPAESGSAPPAAAAQEDSSPVEADAPQRPAAGPAASAEEEQPEANESVAAEAAEKRPEAPKLKGFVFEGDKLDRERRAQEKAAQEAPVDEKPAEAEPQETAAAAAPVAPDRVPPVPESPKPKVDIDALVKQVVDLAEQRLWSYEISGEALNALQADKRFVPFPETDLAALGRLLNVAYVNAELYATAVRSVLGLGADSEERVAAIVRQARKLGEAGARLAATATDACQCSRRWDMVGRNHFTVYGFYPSWLPAPGNEAMAPGAGGAPVVQTGKASSAQDHRVKLDFGIFSRIGYFALELNEEGRMPDRKQWSAERGAKQFIRLAHKYLSNVDLVIEARHWQYWDRNAQQQAVAEIWDLLDPGSQDVRNGLVPDGVTIYFPGFVQSAPEAHRRIVELMTQLYEKIHPAGEDQRDTLAGYLSKRLSGREVSPSLNILIGADRLDLSPLEPDKRLLGNLKFLGDLKEILVGDRQIVDLVLVLLGQPVGDLKKKLRLTVENEFQGEERIDVLRRIVPVVPPNGHKEHEGTAISAKWGSTDDPYRQLYHDLFYFRDNFRGVAFWPAVAATANAQRDPQTDILHERLIRVFSQSDEQGEGGWISELLGQDPCFFVCPNRWYLEVVFFVLFGGLILFAALTYWSCRLRRLVVSNFLPVLAFVALLILIFVAFITCVPTWQDLQSTILGTLLVLLIGSWVLYYIHKVKQGPLP